MRLRDFTQDEVAFQEVYLQNEYRLPDRFIPTDIIVDVGAHIGCFALACLRRGAHRILCFEPDPANFALLVENMRPYNPIVGTHPVAVWRSDRDEAVSLYAHTNRAATAMSYIRPYDPLRDRCQATPGVPLDAILEDAGVVRLLKLDCEGSEYPILYTSKELHRVQEIVMESHEKMGFPEWEGQCNSRGLAAVLRGEGFAVTIEPNPACPDINHHLFARRA